jgi:uncharacterized protein (DUF488 family)
MLHRQRTLLYFLHLAGGAASRLQITKWAFLLKNESASSGGDAFYEFVPYKLGPFSFCLYQEVAALTEQGLITSELDMPLKLTEQGEREALCLAPDLRSDAWRIHKRYGALSGNALMDSVYPRYKRYTCLSNYKKLSERPTGDIAIYTIGYEGLSVDGFLDVLVQNGIRQLIDVRNNPIARKYGFHKSTLNRLCRDLDIDYIHVPELGIPCEFRQNLDTQADRDRLFDLYERTILVQNHEKVKEVAHLLSHKASALMCMEAQPCQCHRSRLAIAIKKLTDLPINHLQSPCTTALPLFNASVY